jgi:hypothetical protein
MATAASSPPAISVVVAAGIACASPSASSLSTEDARLFHDLTSAEAVREQPHLFRLQVAQAFEARVGAAPANILSKHDTNSATPLSSDSDARLAALLAAFTPAVLRRLIARMGGSLAAGNPDECDVTSRVLSALCGVEGFATQMVELSALPVCVHVMRSEGVNPGLLWATKMVSEQCDGGKRTDIHAEAMHHVRND